MNPDFFIDVKDIVIPNFMYNPFKIDNAVLNDIFSDLGGIIPSQVMLLTGVPGSGKTTLACYIGSHISDFIVNNERVKHRPHGPVVLISREMSNFQIKLLSQKVANFGEIKILQSSAKIDHMDEWMNDIVQLHPSLIILDSIQQLAKEMCGSVSANEEKIITIFKDIAQTINTPMLLIGHVTKSGNFKGKNSLQHDVDTHIHINFDKETGEREITLEKNRFGSISKNAIMRFDDNCISIVSNFLNEDSSTDKTYDEIIQEFHIFNKDRKTVSQTSVELTYTSLIEHLKNKYSERLEKVGRPIGSIKIFFTQGKKCYTDLTKNSIFIGFEELKTMNTDTASVYPVENSYMSIICKTREDKMIWSLLHDFAILLYGNSKDESFFQKLYKIAEENSDLFSYHEIDKE